MAEIPTNKDEIKEQIRETCRKIPHPEGWCPPLISEDLGKNPVCWLPVAPGTFANHTCPEDSNRYIIKECWPNGTWYIHPDSGKDWANYTNCIDKEELEFLTYINKLFVIGYSISLVALIISLIIFLSFRTLKCTRIRIHIQLFLSFILNNIMWLIWYLEVIPRSGGFSEENNPFWCQAVEILLRYSLIANYMWMFCEGLYLHLSLVVVFVRDEVAWIWFLLIGWGIPYILVTIYAVFRIYYYEDTMRCWLEPSTAEIIYNVPVYITLFASLIFLINVLRVILTIMNPNSDNPTSARMKRTARAALILIPLFGLQYALIPFRPEKGSAYAYLYEYVTVAITSYQGLVVSCIFCFANQDVHHAIIGFINRKLYGTNWSNYQYTGAMDSAGVYTINGNNSKSIRML